MKKVIILALTIIIAGAAESQINKIDTNYATQAVSAVWMPDGKSFLIAVVKFHKTDRNAGFVSKVYRYNIAAKQLTALFENGSNLAPSPDGKTIAFLKRDDDIRADIYFYNIETARETLFKTDTSRKNALSWSPDGKNLMYNTAIGGIAQEATIEICVLNLETKQVRQITHSGSYKSYDPNWSPDSKNIVYYFEKGDGHDQIWLTDAAGSFHRNLSSDTTTHNYFPSWFDEQTILYTQDPETIMLMNKDGTNRRKVDGIRSYHVKYNSSAGLSLYIREDNNHIILFDGKTRKETIVLDGKKMIEQF